jgi:hypothetical protein
MYCNNLTLNNPTLPYRDLFNYVIYSTQSHSLGHQLRLSESTSWAMSPTEPSPKAWLSSAKLGLSLAGFRALSWAFPSTIHIKQNQHEPTR